MKPFLDVLVSRARALLPAPALLASVLAVAACTGQPAAKTAPQNDAPPASAAEAPEPEAAGNSEPKSMGKALEELYGSSDPAEATGDASEGPAGILYPEPPDGEWLVDEDDRRYFITEIPKMEGHYRRLGEDRIRLRYGYILDLADETEDTFLVKIYKVEPPEPRPTGPNPEQVAEIEALYVAEDLVLVDGPAFQPFDSGLPRQGHWRNGFDVADMNGDGHPDIVHGPPRRGFVGRPVIYLGDGAGTWRMWEEARFPQAPYDYGDAEAADFNADGTMDLALGVHLGGLAVLVGDGEGGFSRWDEGLTLVPAGQVGSDLFTSRAVDSVDWDGDGLPDFVALSEGPRHPKAVDRESVPSPGGLVVFRNQGDGSWLELDRLGAGVDLFGDAIAVGDVDGDGKPDLVSGSNVLGPRAIVFLNRGNEARPLEVEAVRPLSIVWSVGAADFDGDGLDDVALGSTGYRVEEWWGALDVLLARKAEDGTLSFDRRTLIGGRETPELRVSALGTGDVDGDGDVDLVTGTGEGVVSVYLGDGRGGFVRRRDALTEPVPGCRTYHVRLADLDGDGAQEVVAGFAGEKCPGGGSLRAWKSVAR